MKKLSLFSFGTLILGLSYSAFASIPSIPIAGGRIGPKAELYINFPKLEAGVFYQLSCKIHASNSTILNFKSTAGGLDVHVNGKDIMKHDSIMRGANIAFRKGVNDFKTSVTPYALEDKIRILNLDDEVTIEVLGCSLTPIES